jgi:hypothetical protein
MDGDTETMVAVIPLLTPLTPLFTGVNDRLSAKEWLNLFSKHVTIFNVPDVLVGKLLIYFMAGYAERWSASRLPAEVANLNGLKQSFLDTFTSDHSTQQAMHTLFNRTQAYSESPLVYAAELHRLNKLARTGGNDAISETALCNLFVKGLVVPLRKEVIRSDNLPNTFEPLVQLVHRKHTMLQAEQEGASNLLEVKPLTHPKHAYLDQKLDDLVLVNLEQGRSLDALLRLQGQVNPAAPSGSTPSEWPHLGQ